MVSDEGIAPLSKSASFTAAAVETGLAHAPDPASALASSPVLPSLPPSATGPCVVASPPSRVIASPLDPPLEDPSAPAVDPFMPPPVDPSADDEVPGEAEHPGASGSAKTRTWSAERAIARIDASLRPFTRDGVAVAPVVPRGITGRRAEADAVNLHEV